MSKMIYIATDKLIEGSKDEFVRLFLPNDEEFHPVKLVIHRY